MRNDFFHYNHGNKMRRCKRTKVGEREEKITQRFFFVNKKILKVNLLCSLEIENLAPDRCFLDYCHLPFHLEGLNRPLTPILGNFPSQI
jgi:hypothetical protein